MFTSLEKFWSDYRIQNGQQPNETVLNRGLMRLKREIRELKSIQDIIRDKQIASWNKNSIYEQDEYVQHNGLIFKSLIDSNFDDEPGKTDTWEIQDIETISDKNIGVRSNEFISEKNQRVFKCDFTFNCKPTVFLDGILQDSDTYTYSGKEVCFSEPLLQGRKVVITISYSYENTLLLPKREFVVKEPTQFEFETGFKIVEPEVFVNGKLLPTSEYSYSAYTVELNDPVPNGTVVVIENGNTAGYELYTKKDIDDRFDNVYTKDDVYTKVETDNLLNKKADYTYSEITYAKKEDVCDKNYVNDLINNNNNEINDKLNSALNTKADKAYTLEGYGITDAYTKAEIDQFRVDWMHDFKEDITKNYLDSKADKSTTLSGYGILDAYTKAEVESIANTKFDKDDFDRPHILEALGSGLGLNADTLDNLDSSQFMRADIKATNTGGIESKSSITSDKVDINFERFPNIKISTNEWVNKDAMEKDADEFKTDSNVFTSLNSNHLYYVVEGEFSGTWYSNINDFGILYPDDYNWFVNVFPQIQGPMNDFVPEDFPTDYKFRGFVENNQEWEQTTYHFGYINNSIVKLYSWYKNGSDSWLPIPSRYQLIGIHKDICTRRERNQDNDKLSYFQFNNFSDKENDILHNLVINKKIDHTTPDVPNMQDEFKYVEWTRISNGQIVDSANDSKTYNDELALTTKGTKKSAYKVRVKSNKYKIENDEYVYIYARGIKPGEHMIWSIEGDGEIVESKDIADVSGDSYCVVRGKIPFFEQIRVTCRATESGSDYVVINCVHVYRDDPDTTFMFEASDTFDHTVFTVSDSDSANKDDPDTTIVFDVTAMNNSVFSYNT